MDVGGNRVCPGVGFMRCVWEIPLLGVFAHSTNFTCMTQRSGKTTPSAGYAAGLEIEGVESVSCCQSR